MKKWFLMAFIFIVGIISASNIPVVHPYHVGSVEINYNDETHTYQITAKFFLDDLEDAVNQYQKHALFFYKKEHQDLLHQALSKYIRERMLIKNNDQSATLYFLGYEEAQESVYLYLESKPTAPPKKVTVGVNVLYDLFDDQMNIIHLKVNGKRKSHKLDYPAIYFTAQF